MTEAENFSLNEHNTLEILSQLIRIRTVLPWGDEKDMVKYILSLFPEGVLTTRLFDHGANRASLTALLPGKDSSRKITFVGHMDTFPIVGEEQWAHPPFAADFEDGIVYGRGASNMKGGIAAIVMTLLYFVKNNIVPPCDLILCLTADGDSAALTGARAIAKSAALAEATELIFAEATDSHIATAQRGGVWLRIKVTGMPSYACIPGVGVDALAKFLELHSYIKNYISRDSCSYQYLGDPLCTITQLKSGIAMNVIPDTAEGTVDIRLLPMQDNEDITAFAIDMAQEMMKEEPRLKIEIEVLSSNAAVGMPDDSPLVKRFEKVLANSTGEQRKKRGLLYYTDACALVPVTGVPFLLFGPGANIYHTLIEESVSLASVVEAAKIFVKYINEPLE